MALVRLFKLEDRYPDPIQKQKQISPGQQTNKETPPPYTTLNGSGVYDLDLDIKYGYKPGSDWNYANAKEKEDNQNSTHKKHMQEVNNGEEVPTWTDFTQNTTLHGIKYIFEESSKPRKSLWLICVIAAIIAFTSQVCWRAAVFFEYQTNVGVQVHYVDRVPFPAVTLCNQNSFRISQTGRKGLYDFIEQVYSASNFEDVDIDNYTTQFEKENAGQFFLSTAHQKRDLIVKCTWGSKNCDVDSDFKLVVTDLGVCFTFNGDIDNSSLAVAQTGSKHALSLILNVEQYEYMKGPQNDAGVKILLHDPGEVPLMGDLGFAVAPGTHTLVGIKISIVTSLESPYGTCHEYAPPMSNCIAECRASNILQQCNCSLDYIVNRYGGDNVALCNLTSHFQCASLQGTMSNSCQCQVPCNRTLYENSLSHAMLSKFNIEKLAVGDENRIAEIKERFINAREMAQHVREEIRERDQLEINNALKQMLHMGTLILENAGIVNVSAGLAEKYNVSDFIALAKNAIQQDWNAIEKSIEEKHNKLFEYYDKVSFPQLNFVNFFLQNIEQFRYASSENESISLSELRLKNCTDEDFEPPQNPDTVCVKFGHIPQDIESVSDCNCVLYILNKISPYGGFMTYYTTISVMATLKNKYQQIMEELFPDMSHPVERLVEHDRCQSFLDSYQESYVPLMTNIINKLKEFSTVSTFSEAYKVAKEINDVALRQDKKEIKANINSCAWYRIYSSYYKDKYGRYSENETVKLNVFRNHMSSANQDLSFLQTNFKSLGKKFNKVYKTYIEEILPLSNVLTKYKNGAISKVELAKIFVLSDLTKFREYISYYESAFEDYMDELNGIADDLNTAFHSLYAFAIPILTDDIVYNLLTWKNLINASSNSMVRQNIDQYMEDPSSKFKGALKKVIGPFRDHPNLFAKDLIKIHEMLQGTQNKLKANLISYQAGNLMDANFYMENFMQVDIFYKELSYEKIEQQVAFELLSLFGEIGGFLGLLLGASVLTVVELLDHLSQICIKKLKAKESFTTTKNH